MTYPNTKGVLYCLYLVVNFQVKTQVPLWGKYYKRKVITRLQKVSSFRVTVVVIKIIFKLFLVLFCKFYLAINEEKIQISIVICILYYYIYNKFRPKMVKYRWLNKKIRDWWLFTMLSSSTRKNTSNYLHQWNQTWAISE